MSAVVMMAPRRAPALQDEDVVRLAMAVLSDPRAWAVTGRTELDPALMRTARARALALLRDALETV
jgi:hypothetical protein